MGTRGITAQCSGDEIDSPAVRARGLGRFDGRGSLLCRSREKTALQTGHFAVTCGWVLCPVTSPCRDLRKPLLCLLRGALSGCSSHAPHVTLFSR